MGAGARRALVDRAQSLRYELDEMRETLNRTRDEQIPFGSCHLRDMQWINCIEIDRERLRRPAKRLLEDTQCSPPGIRITLAEMSP